MKHALNAADIKRTNQRLILDAIFQSGTTSRTQLARELRLSKPAISDNLQKLLDLGIVTEIGEGSAGPAGGRKSILLQFNPGHRYIIAVNLEYSRPFFALTDLCGNILESFDIAIVPGNSLKMSCDQVLEGIEKLLCYRNIRREQVYCIAMAAPGVFNTDGDQVSYNSNCSGPAWWLLDMKKILREAFGLPVIIQNGIKAATLGEQMHGAGKQEENLLYLHVGLGIGCGILLNGRLLMGEHFSAGEIYDYYDPANAHRGQKLEDTICIDYLKDQCLRAKDSPFAGREEITLEDILGEYSRGDPAVVSVVTEICQRLAVLSHNYMNFLSLNRIIFGGDYVPFGDCFARYLRELFEGSPRPQPDIRTSVLGKHAGIQGIAALARERYFQDICGN